MAGEVGRVEEVVRAAGQGKLQRQGPVGSKLGCKRPVLLLAAAAYAAAGSGRASSAKSSAAACRWAAAHAALGGGCVVDGSGGVVTRVGWREGTRARDTGARVVDTWQNYLAERARWRARWREEEDSDFVGRGIDEIFFFRFQVLYRSFWSCFYK